MRYSESEVYYYTFVYFFLIHWRIYIKCLNGLKTTIYKNKYFISKKILKRLQILDIKFFLIISFIKIISCMIKYYFAKLTSINIIV